MPIITLSARAGTEEQVLGAIGCNRLAPVADYTLVVHGSEGPAFKVPLTSYSRWTEPAMALLVRLLERIPAEHRPTVAELNYASASIFMGRSLHTARLLEHLVVQRRDSQLLVKFVSEFDSSELTELARDEYTSPFDLIGHGVRLAIWGSDTLPPVPPPLSAVPVTIVDGIAVVRESDIPSFPRRHFAQRMNGCTVPRLDHFYATDWYRFIGAQ